VLLEGLEREQGDVSFTASNTQGDIAMKTRREEDMSKPPRAIALSVCVCTANRVEDLVFALESLSKLRIPEGRAVELIVVDNASTDATSTVLSAAAAGFPFPLKTVHEPTRGLSSARNCALRHARGEVIAWTDDDCVPAEDWIECILSHFDEDPSLALLTGRVELYDRSHYPISINTSLEPAILDKANPWVLGANMAFRRHLIECIGLYDPRFGAGAPLRAGEDVDFAFRLLRAGYRAAYTPDVLVYHNHKRVTHDQVMRLRRNYIHAEGALLMKYVVARDGTAARQFYWRLCHSVNRVLHPPAWLLTRMDSATLLVEFLAGALAYVGFALRVSPMLASDRDSRRQMSAP